MAQILVVEDEESLLQTLRYNLSRAGHEVRLSTNGVQALEMIRGNPPELVVLDLMLPGLDGLELCRAVRADTLNPTVAHVPILMLTARDEEIDKVVGLEVGADDYLTKPFSVMELVARVKAIFRRSDALAPRATTEAPKVIRAGELEIEPDKRQVTLAGRPVELTAKEFDLLVHFARNPGRVYSRSELLDAVWGYSHSGYEHTVNSHINRLRMKIEADPAKPRYILTVWSVGYKFNEAAGG
jgi:DNA-binding response OmpR family regulator